MNDKIRTSTLIKMKAKGQKIAALTAYDYTFAELLDESGIELILVGDSCGNVCAGYDTTVPVTLNEIIYHTRSVSRGVKRALLVADLPFMTYQVSEDDALRNAGRLMKEGLAEAVKIEGGAHICPTIKKLVQIGIPVMGHLGLTPQSVHGFGGFGLRGKKDTEAEKIKADALALQEAGVFSIVLEKIPADLAKEISQSLKIPTIGIGAGPECDGQILVTYDMLGLFDKFKPKFVRHFAKLADEIRKSVQQYSDEVKSNQFPNESESY